MSQICGQATGLSDAQFWKRFSGKVYDQRVPMSGSLALTHCCNLGCIHCYIKEAQPEDSGSELGTDQWLKIVAAIKETGCLYLLLTGGEPLLREDFAEIYTSVKQNGFLVTVFTNGTLITDTMVDLFRKLPPRLVEISLYGASAKTHDRITGVVGSFERTRQGIETLIGQGIHVVLKSVLMTHNLDEFSAIETLAHDYGVKFRFDAAIFPTLGGDQRPIDLRVSPEQAVALEFSDPGRVREWHEFLDRFRSIPKGEDLFVCGAGKTTFHIDPQGWLYPCLMVRGQRYSLADGNFQAGWNQDISRIHKEKMNRDFPCRHCDQKLLCGYCPGFFDLENSQKQVQSDYLCAIGKVRSEYIAQKSVGG